jgi:fatty acid desaturase
MLEHIQSHHMHTNSDMDHDRHSMRPFVTWKEGENVVTALDKAKSVALLSIIFFFGELIVAIGGMLDHGFRRTYYKTAPGSSIAPWLFPLRVGIPIALHGMWGGLLIGVLPTCLASFYFTVVAHCTHMSTDALNAGNLNYPEVSASSEKGLDWGLTQLATSKDIAGIFEGSRARMMLGPVSVCFRL